MIFKNVELTSIFHRINYHSVVLITDQKAVCSAEQALYTVRPPILRSGTHSE